MVSSSILLVGFMGTGKSAVGERLAERLGWTFVDLDEEVARGAGQDIPGIFEREGEAGFRARERQALRAQWDKPRRVISCGGGIVTVPENLRDLCAHPGAVCLEAGESTIWNRIGADPNRPMLRGDSPRSRVSELLALRQPLYNRFPLRIATDGLAPDEVADRILRRLALA